jgi:DNA topoisomerase-1
MDVDVDEDEDDIPLVKRIPVIQNKRVKMDVDEDEDEDDIPLAQRIPTAKLVKKKPVKSTSNNLSSSLAAKKVVEARKSKFKKQQKKLVAKARDSKQVKSAPGADGGQKWTHLEHNGVIFPPPYKPHGVKMLYEGKPVVLTPEQEEVRSDSFVYGSPLAKLHHY